jgi:hypothetical protein
LSEEDRKRLTAKRRRRIIGESETEGTQGISGRDSINLFNKFYSKYAKDDKLIDMSMVEKFFGKDDEELAKQIPEGFLESLLGMYNYAVLQEVKESLFYYNEKRISKDIQNYLFAVNFEVGTTRTCSYTNEKLEITDEFFDTIERHLLGADSSEDERLKFRESTQREYAAKTLTQEIMVENIPIHRTKIFEDLRNRYTHHLKERVLEPFLKNENFRRAIKDYEEKEFKAYDKRIKDDVRYLMKNLRRHNRYTKQGAKEICIYVIDNDLANRYGTQE